MSDRSEPYCETWPACGCFSACEDDNEPRSRWAVPFGCILCLLVWAAILGGLWLLYPSPADAHQAPSGWSYPYLCCSDRDCTEVKAERVKEGPEGYRVTLLPGDHAFVKAQVSFLIPYSEIKFSPDGEYHLCINERLEVLCFFAGARGY